VSWTGFVLTGRRVGCTRYRPDRWRTAELLTAASGIAVAVLVIAATRVDPAALTPSLSLVAWPTVPLLAALGCLVGVLPAFLTPQPPPDAGIPLTPESDAARPAAGTRTPQEVG